MHLDDVKKIHDMPLIADDIDLATSRSGASIKYYSVALLFCGLQFFWISPMALDPHK